MRLILTISLILFSFSTVSAPVVLHKTFDAISAEFVTENVLKVETSFNSSTDKAYFEFIIPYIDVNGHEKTSCKSSERCAPLQLQLNKKRLQFHLKAYDRDSDTFTGDFFIDGENLTHHLIRNGYYKFDYKQSRNKVLVHLQKEAMCNAEGLWAEQTTHRKIVECN